MMGTNPSLLIEIGTEELPPKALDELAGALARGVCDGLVQRGIASDVANAKTYCSPRRLAVWTPGSIWPWPTRRSAGWPCFSPP
jgi:glycyl-tRNA synthetase beta chain